MNVRILNRIGRLLELTASTIDHSIDIIRIHERRYIHSEYIKYHDTGDEWMFVFASTWKHSVNATIGGLDMLIKPRTLKVQNNIEKIQPRMIVATFTGNPRATIIFCNIPANLSEETDLIAIYKELYSLVRSIPKHNVLVIGGDMNAQIGKTKTTYLANTTHQTETGNI